MALTQKIVAAQLGRVSTDLIRVGKDVIEILTTGMYVSPLSIYREYVQNGADSIDEGRRRGLLAADADGSIRLTIDHEHRCVTIRDNGVGLPVQSATATLLAIGSSPKRGTDARGFRGVGRLCGLAYCRELEFRTKAKGDAHAQILTWDCRGLRVRLSDPAYSADIRETIADVVTTRRERVEDRSEHFFEVTLRDISRFRQDILLNEKLVSHFLAQTAPVAFSDGFRFAGEIEARLAVGGTRVPVRVWVGNDPVLKPYRNKTQIPGTENVITIDRVEFVEFADVDGGIGGIAWIGHHEYTRSLPVGLGIRGLRARVGDVQVGDANLFDESFKEARFNGWVIGEIHVFDRRVVPNARRDNFEVNHHSANLLAQVGPIAARLSQVCRTTSVSRNAALIVQNSIADIEGRLAARRRVDRAELSRMRAALSRARTKFKAIVDEKLRARLAVKVGRLEEKLSSLKPSRGPAVVAVEEALALINKLVTNRGQARKLSDALQRLSG
jgi:molecular chaperone HtpG